MAIGDVLASAAVEIVAELDSFEPDLRRKLTAAVESAGADLDKEMARQGRKAGQSFGDNFGSAAQRELRGDRGLFAREGESAGSSFGDGFKRAADRDGRDSGKSFLDAFSLSLAGLRGSLTSFAPLFAAGIGPVIAGLVAATAAAVQLSGVVALIPAGLAAAGVVAGTLALGLRGIGDALKAAASGDAEKLSEAMKNLSPNAQSFVRAIQSLTPAFKSLQLGVQDALFNQIGESVRRLASAALPTLRAGLTSVATGLSQIGRTALNAFAQPASIQALAAVLANVRAALDQLRPAIAPIIAAFSTLARVGSGFLPQLAAGFTTLAQRFNAFVQQASQSGALAEFIQGGIDAVASLGRVVGNVARIIGGLAKAGDAAGGGLFAFLENITGGIADFVNSAAGIQHVRNLLAAVGLVGQQLLAGLRPIWEQLPLLSSAFLGVVQAVAPLLPVLGKAIALLVGPLAGLVQALLPALTSIVGSLGPVLTQIGAGLAQVLTAVAPLVALLGQGLATVVGQLAGMLLQLLPVFAQFSTALVAGLQPVVAALIPVLVQVVAAAGTLLQALLPLLPALLPLVAAGAQLSLSFAQILVALAPLITLFAQLAAVFIGQAAPAIVFLAGQIVGLVTSFASLISGVARVITVIVNFVVQFVTAFTQLRSQGASIVSALAGAIVATFGEMVAQALGFLRGLVSQGIGILAGFAAQAAGKARELAAGILSAIRSGLSGLAGVFRAPFDAAKSAVSSALAGILSTVEGFVSRISGAISRISSAISGIPRPNFPGISIPFFANGTIANRPTLGVIGEAGPEVVIPLTRPKRRDELMRQTGLDQVAAATAGGGGRTKEIHIPIHAAAASATEVADMVAATLERFGFKPTIGLQTSGGTI